MKCFRRVVSRVNNFGLGTFSQKKFVASGVFVHDCLGYLHLSLSDNICKYLVEHIALRPSRGSLPVCSLPLLRSILGFSDWLSKCLRHSPEVIFHFLSNVQKIRLWALKVSIHYYKVPCKNYVNSVYKSCEIVHRFHSYFT